eukprot:2012721-Rhodomonas_salina.1
MQSQPPTPQRKPRKLTSGVCAQLSKGILGLKDGTRKQSFAPSQVGHVRKINNARSAAQPRAKQTANTLGGSRVEGKSHRQGPGR